MAGTDGATRANVTASVLCLSCACAASWLPKLALGEGATLTTRNAEVLALVTQTQLMVGIILYATPNAGSPSPNPLNVIASAMWGVAYLIVGTMGFHFLAVMFGAPLLSKVDETLMFSFCMSALAVFPGGCVFGADWRKAVKFYLNLEPASPLEVLLMASLLSPMVGAWVGAWAVPLDWDRPWQPWPISSSYGALAAYCAGMLVSIALNSLRILVGKKDKES